MTDQKLSEGLVVIRVDSLNVRLLTFGAQYQASNFISKTKFS